MQSVSRQMGDFQNKIPKWVWNDDYNLLILQ